MKIAGVNVNGPNMEILVLPRIGGDIVIRAAAVCDMAEFEQLCPLPKPPVITTKDGPVPQLKDKTFLQKCEAHGTRRMAYMVLKSLEPSDIEWDTVEMGNPKTWPNWEKELRDSGFADIEVNRITMCVMQANSLDENKLKEARDLFLRGEAEVQEASSGPQTEPESTPSGVPASDGE